MICASAVSGALALVGDADEGRDGAAGLEPHGRSLLARDRRAPDAVELGARAGELDEAGEPDSHVAPSGARGLLFPPQPIVVGGLQEPRQRGLIAAAVEDVAGRRGVGKIFRVHQIAAARLGGIEPEVARDEIDHALGHRGGDRMSHRAVLRGDDLVLRHHAQGRVVVPHAVRPGQQPQHLAALDDARARIRRVRADRGGDARAHRGQDAHGRRPRPRHGSSARARGCRTGTTRAGSRRTSRGGRASRRARRRPCRPDRRGS